MADERLTVKQQRFVDEYLVSGNATQAAIRAGYSESSARAAGSKLLGKAHVAAAIRGAQERRAERVEVDHEGRRAEVQLTQDWVLAQLVENARRCMQSIPVTDREGNETGEYKHEPAAANKALELIGKHLGMFPNRHEVTGKNGGPMEILGAELGGDLFADPAARDEARSLIAKAQARSAD